MYVPVAPPVYNWSGIYVGVNGGWGFGYAKWTNPNVPASNSNQDSGGVIGGTLGANYQMSSLVIGFEGDLDWSDINTGRSGLFCNATAQCQTGNNWLGTLRGRVGYAMDRVLFYGTGGGVFGNFQFTATGVTNAKTQTGWTAGVGVEVAFADNWTAKVEYLYANLGNGTCTTACGSPPLPISIGLTDNLVRGGVNYKFNF
jgi:outer membrane immunogenic protein